MGRRIRRTAVVVITVITFAVGAGAYLLRDPSPVGYWRSAPARAAYQAEYDRAFRDVPSPTQTSDVRTGFGIVRAYRFGDPTPGTAPIVMLPGRTSGAPMWAEMLTLLRDREVYALDALGDAGMSVQDRPIDDAQDQADWLAQALIGLGLNRVHLVGHSFGAWSAANLAMRYPERVATLTLWEPVLVFAGLRLRMYLASLPTALPFLPDSWRRKGLATIGGAGQVDADASAIGAMIDAGAAGYRARLPTPERSDAGGLARLTMPVFVGLGARSAVTDTDAAARTARSVATATVRIWPDGTHSLPMQYPGELHAELTALIARQSR